MVYAATPPCGFSNFRLEGGGKRAQEVWTAWVSRKLKCKTWYRPEEHSESRDNSDIRDAFTTLVDIAYIVDPVGSLR